jgi:UDP-N-acetylmuramoyl-tripeptide--D-alanyl-D-alanine ligase
MTRYTLSEILKASSGRLLLKGADTFTGISIDSRTIQDGELFIALQGESFDGHNFVHDALRAGSGTIVSYPPVIPSRGKSIIHVNNTLTALQSIARHRRLQRNIKVVGITGTNGKTTTKEMIASILARRYRVLRSEGNLNNQIGLPLSLAGLNNHDIAVLEMGASRSGDIRELSDIARPDIGVITNIAPAHLEGFGSMETVLKTKLELLEYVNTLIINGDDTHLISFLSGRPEDKKRVITFGLSSDSDIWAEDVRYGKYGISFRLHTKEGVNTEISLRVFGSFNVLNALASVAVCSLLKVPHEIIQETLEAFHGVPMRLELKEFKGAIVISDLYNANPASMEEAIRELLQLKKARAIAVLGDMLELGAYGEEAHRKLGRWLATLPVDILITVGDLMAYTREEFLNANGGKPAYHVKDPQEARTILFNMVKKDDTVLIKGSRGLKLERILEG